MLLVIPVVPRAEADQGTWVLLVPLLIAGSGLGMLVSQLNNFTLAPIEEERASEAAGVNSAAGNFGLSFGLAVAGGLMLATMSFAFTTLTDDSTIIPADQKQAIATAMEDDAQVVSDDQLQALLVDEPADVQAEILAINDDARALSLQVAMLIPVLACLLGLINAFRMVRLPDIEASSSFEGLDLA
jgi:nitrate/nitrite transporter NarK